MLIPELLKQRHHAVELFEVQVQLYVQMIVVTVRKEMREHNRPVGYFIILKRSMMHTRFQRPMLAFSA